MERSGAWRLRSGHGVCRVFSHHLAFPRAACVVGRSHITGGRVEGEKVRAYGNSGLKVTFYCDLDEGETGVFVGREEKACSLLTKAAKTVESCSKPSKS